MLRSLSGLFSSHRGRGTSPARRARRPAPSRFGTALSVQQLEQRHALAFTVNTVSLSTSPTPAGTFGYIISIDDSGVNQQHVYMATTADGEFFIDTDPNFASPNLQRRTNAGNCTTILVTSSNSLFTSGAFGLTPDAIAGSTPGFAVSTFPGPTNGSLPHAFTFVGSATTIPNQRLLVDLSPAGSSIDIGAQWQGSRGYCPGGIQGQTTEWTAYANYGGGSTTTGQIALFATNVSIDADVSVQPTQPPNSASTVSRFTADASAGGFAGRPNFGRNNISATSTGTNNVVTLAIATDAAWLAPGMTVTGGGLPAGTTITSVAGTSVTLSNAAAAGGLTFNARTPNEPVRNLNVNADITTKTSTGAVGPGTVRFNVSGTDTIPGVIRVAPSAVVTASVVDVTAAGTDVRYEGTINGDVQTYLLNAASTTDSNTYTFTTLSSATGLQSGTLASTGNIGITMGNPAGGTVNLRTAANRLAFTSAAVSGQQPPPYSVTLSDTDNLQITSVASSSGPISITTGTPGVAGSGSLTIAGSAFQTAGDLRLTAYGSLNLGGSIGTSNGDIRLQADTLTLASLVTAGGGGDVQLFTNTGDTTVNALSRAGGSVIRSVRVASEKSYNLSFFGAWTVNNVPLADKDRVLFKNQTNATENGVYAYNAVTGEMKRATDLDTAAEFVPGFVVYAVEGDTSNPGMPSLSQEGGWVFQNPVQPVFSGTGINQTSLSFVPVSVPVAYTNVRLATTAAQGNVTLSGSQTIDGTLAVPGDRVLVKNQDNAAENGVYVAATGSWKRAGDASSPATLVAGGYVFVTGGTQQSGTGWVLANDAISVGTTQLFFLPFTQQDRLPALPPKTIPFWAPQNVLRDVDVASTGDLVLAGKQSVDGILLVGGERVLVKNQIDPTQNGVYDVPAPVAGTIGAWTRSTDADTNAKLVRGTVTYVLRGTQSGGTSWNFDDSVRRLGATSLNSTFVTGLTSTTGLFSGMLVTGDGIPANTTIASVVDNTTVRLSTVVPASQASVPLLFTPLAATVLGATPIAFLPAAGDISIASARSVGGASRLQGAAALLVGGTVAGVGQAASTINARIAVGSLTASAPAGVTLDNSTAVDLASVGTTIAGPVSVSANGTITATSVTAKGGAAAADAVALTSVFGDVVLRSITANSGIVRVTSVNGGIELPATGSIVTNGSVFVTADTQAPADNPARRSIKLAGRIAALGAGSNASISSANGTVDITATADISAQDQLKLFAPVGPVTIATSKFTGDRLSWTAAGNLFSPLAGFRSVNVTRTDDGPLTINSSIAGTLTVEGAATQNGSIVVTAPDILVTGTVRAGDSGLPGNDDDVSLTATAGNVLVDAGITASRSVSLTATGIVSFDAAAAAASLVTAPGGVTFNATGTTKLNTSTSRLDGTLAGTGATLTVVEADGITVGDVKLTGTGGTATITAGTATTLGNVVLEKLDVGSTGTATVTAFGSISGASTAPADLVAGTATLLANGGNNAITLRTNVSGGITATAPQTIAINNIAPLVVQSLTSSGGGIKLTAAGGVTQAPSGRISASSGTGLLDVTASDDVVLTNATNDVNALSITTTVANKNVSYTDANGLVVGGTGIQLAKPGIVTLNVLAGQLTQAANAKITATTLNVTAAAGAVTLADPANDVDNVAISAPNQAISYRDANGFAVAAPVSGTYGIDGAAVTLVAGGAVTQAAPINATTLDLTGNGTAIALTNAGNKIGTLKAANGAGAISVVDSSLGLVLDGIVGGAVTLASTGSGPITQATGTSLDVATLDVTGNGQAVTLTNAGNRVGTFKATNGSGAVTLTDSNLGLVLDAVTGGAVTINTATAAGTVTQAAGAAITATTLDVTGNGQAITLTNAGNRIGTLKAANAAGDISVSDSDLALVLDAVTGGVVTINTAAAAGTISQAAAAAINAATLDVTGNGQAITLANAANKVGTFRAANGSGAVSLTDSTLGLVLDAVTGGLVTIVSTGNAAITQSAAVNAATLDVTGNGQAVTLTNAGNKVGTFKAANGSGAVSLTDSDADLVLGAITGGAVTILSTGDGAVTQSAAMQATSLTVNRSDATVAPITLDNAANNVATLASAANAAGDVTFVTQGTFSSGPVTAGTVTVGDGNILLKSVSGNINVNGNLTAENDRVTLEARNGSFTLANGVIIDAAMFVYYTLTTPSPDPTTAPAGTYPPIVAANGDLTIGSLVNPQPVTFGSYSTTGNITIIGTSVTITGLLQTLGAGKTVSIVATSGIIDFTGAGGIDNAPALNGTTSLLASLGRVTGLASTQLSGGSTTITVGQPLTFTGGIAANTLSAAAAGSAISLTGANQLGSFASSNGSGNVTVNDSTGSLVLGAITGGAVTVTAAGAVTQSAAVTATTLDVTGTGQAITLTNAGNKVGTFRAANAAGAVSLKDSNGGLVLDGITGGTVTIDSLTGNGTITQTAAVTATTLDVTGNGQAITLTDAGNKIGTFRAANAAGAVSLKDSNGALVLDTLTGGAVTIDSLTGNGTITQSGVINAATLDVTGNGQAVVLNTQNNKIGTFTAANAAGDIAVKDTAAGLVLGAITGGLVTVQSTGNAAMTQSGAITAATLDVTGNGTSITLNTQNNAIGEFRAANGGGAVSVNDTVGGLALGTITSGGLTVAAAGPLAVNQSRVVATGNVKLSTAAGGLTVTGPQPGGLLSSVTQIDLSAVQGPIALVDGGRIVAPKVIGNGQSIQVGGTVTTASGLNQAVSTVNALQPIAGSTYEIVVGADIPLTQTLAITSPVLLRGNAGVQYILSNGGGVTTGLSLNSGASGSTVRDLAFSGFSANGILLSSAQRVNVTNVVISSSGVTGAGLTLTGNSTGTTVLGNTFNNNPYAIRLTGATGATVGGTLAGQANTVNNSSKAGVFASGFCTNSQIIKTAFTRTPVPYNVSTARNLKIVK